MKRQITKLVISLLVLVCTTQCRNDKTIIIPLELVDQNPISFGFSFVQDTVIYLNEIDDSLIVGSNADWTLKYGYRKDPMP